MYYRADVYIDSNLRNSFIKKATIGEQQLYLGSLNKKHN